MAYRDSLFIHVMNASSFIDQVTIFFLLCNTAEVLHGRLCCFRETTKNTH